MEHARGIVNQERNLNRTSLAKKKKKEKEKKIQTNSKQQQQQQQQAKTEIFCVHSSCVRKRIAKG